MTTHFLCRHAHSFRHVARTKHDSTVKEAFKYDMYNVENSITDDDIYGIPYKADKKSGYAIKQACRQHSERVLYGNIQQ